MPIDDLTALGQKMREARKNKELTQQELSDLSHVYVKQIANIEKGKMNPSYLILRALAKVLHISLDTLINPDISLEDEGVNQMKMLYSSCKNTDSQGCVSIDFTLYYLGDCWYFPNRQNKKSQSIYQK